jgi:hypothetical protein
MKAGDSFIPAKPFDHLWIILSDPTADPQQVVIVNCTTWPDEEETCILRRGDHPFIKHKTAVRYSDARITTVDDLSTLVKNKLLTPKAPVSADVLQRVRDGASASDFLREGVRRVLEDQGVI